MWMEVMMMLIKIMMKEVGQATGHLRIAIWIRTPLRMIGIHPAAQLTLNRVQWPKRMTSLLAHPKQGDLPPFGRVMVEHLRVDEVMSS